MSACAREWVFRCRPPRTSTRRTYMIVWVRSETSKHAACNYSEQLCASACIAISWPHQRNHAGWHQAAGTYTAVSRPDDLPVAPLSAAVLGEI